MGSNRRHPGGRTCLGALLLLPATLPFLAARAALIRLAGDGAKTQCTNCGSTSCSGGCR